RSFRREGTPIRRIPQFRVVCEKLRRSKGQTTWTMMQIPHRKARTRCVGLARALSKLGYCSRSQAAELIRAGRVSLNGRVARDIETPVRIAADRIEVDGLAVRSERSVYY